MGATTSLATLAPNRLKGGPAIWVVGSLVLEALQRRLGAINMQYGT